MKGASIFLSVLLLSALAAGCNHKACKRICDCMGGDFDECVDDCENELDDVSDDCQKEVRSWARCLDREDCSETKCESEEGDMEDACESLL